MNDLSGPVSYTFDHAGEVRSGARGNPLVYVVVAPVDFVADATAAGVPDEEEDCSDTAD